MEISLVFLGTESICKHHFLKKLPSATAASTPLFLDKITDKIPP